MANDKIPACPECYGHTLRPAEDGTPAPVVCLDCGAHIDPIMGYPEIFDAMRAHHEAVFNRVVASYRIVGDDAERQMLLREERW
jgi:hypothetical protein